MRDLIQLLKPETLPSEFLDFHNKTNIFQKFFQILETDSAPSVILSIAEFYILLAREKRVICLKICTTRNFTTTKNIEKLGKV